MYNKHQRKEFCNFPEECHLQLRAPTVRKFFCHLIVFLCTGSFKRKKKGTKEHNPTTTNPFPISHLLVYIFLAYSCRAYNRMTKPPLSITSKQVFMSKTTKFPVLTASRHSFLININKMCFFLIYVYKEHIDLNIQRKDRDLYRPIWQPTATSAISICNQMNENFII